MLIFRFFCFTVCVGTLIFRDVQGVSPDLYVPRRVRRYGIDTYDRDNNVNFDDDAYVYFDDLDACYGWGFNEGWHFLAKTFF